MSKKVIILGSCVTRDAFELTPNSHQILLYIARTSFGSSFDQKKFALGSSDVDSNHAVSSPWQKKMLDWDIHKHSADELKKYIADTDAIIVDFVDERFNLVESNQTFATVSVAFQTAHPKHEFRVIRNDSQEHFERWKKGFETFLAVASEYHKRVIINAVTLGFQTSDHTELFKLDHIHRQNFQLQKKHDYVSQNHPYCDLYRNPLPPYLDENHKWGKAPFHYETSYYTGLMNHLELVANLAL